MNKLDVLSDEALIDTAEGLYNFRNAMDIKGIKETLWQLVKQQLNVAVTYYELLIQQTRKETAEKIFERIEKLPFGINQHTMGLDHYDEKGNEVLIHLPDCLKCKYEHVKAEFLGKKEQELPEEKGEK